jgi:hypothetical protein
MKRERYGEIVREMYPPTIDQTKRIEMQIARERVSAPRHYQKK